MFVFKLHEQKKFKKLYSIFRNIHHPSKTHFTSIIGKVFINLISSFLPISTKKESFLRTIYYNMRLLLRSKSIFLPKKLEIFLNIFVTTQLQYFQLYLITLKITTDETSNLTADVRALNMDLSRSFENKESFITQLLYTQP